MIIRVVRDIRMLKTIPSFIAKALITDY